MLNINYTQQFNDYSCGAACLQMVYSFYGLKVSQKEIYERFKTIDPENSKQERIDTDSLVIDAEERGFVSKWIRLPENLRNEKDLQGFVDNCVLKKCPIIVCQRFTRMDKSGHFRVLVGRDEKNVFAHDPHPRYGGCKRKFSTNEFLEYWEPTGLNVTGWVYVIIEPK